MCDEVTTHWRVVQIFLPAGDAAPAVYEVEVDDVARRARCNCLIHQARSSCSHVRLVEARMSQNSGQYPLNLPAQVQTDLSEVLKDRGRFRDFVIRYGRIEVL